MAVDFFQQRTLQKIVHGLETPPSYLLKKFFGNVGYIDTPHFDIDVIPYEGRKLAPFVDPRSGGSLHYLDGFRMKNYRLAYIAPKIPLSGEDTFVRRPGENIYQQFSPNERLQRDVAVSLRKLERLIARREEYMAAQALFTGKIEVSIDGVNSYVNDFWSDYRETPDGTLSDDAPVASVTWTGASVTDILNSLDNQLDSVAEKTSLVPDFALLGRTAAQTLLTQLAAEDAFERKTIHFGDFDPAEHADGVRYLGTLRYPSLDLFTYNAKVIGPSSGALESLVPENQVLLGTIKAETSRVYGPVQVYDERNESVWITGEARVPNSWVQRDEVAGRVVQLTSRVLLTVDQPEAFKVLTVS